MWERGQEVPVFLCFLYIAVLIAFEGVGGSRGNADRESVILCFDAWSCCLFGEWPLGVCVSCFARFRDGVGEGRFWQKLK